MSTTASYDPGFLSVLLAFPGLAPSPKAPPLGKLVDLGYPHFSILFDRARRLAVATGVNVDGGSLREVARIDDWSLDPRVPVAEQAGEDIYADNDLDRGHLVRRRDPVWGEPAVAEAANAATFVFTNAAPQAAEFNQGANLWAGVEDHVLDYARAYRQRISVFTGPIFDPGDPVYRGLAIPRRFWKIAAWAGAPDPDATETDAALRAIGFVLDQTPQLDDLELVTARELAAGHPPPLGPFRTFQVPIADIAAATGLGLTALAEADRFRVRTDQDPDAGTDPNGWLPIVTASEIRL